MALRLKIVSNNAAAAGEHSRWTFGVNGGRIGRHTSNDWVLRDPDRFVSGRHAAIEHRGGTWLLRDTSTNGTFVNDADEALGPDRMHQLAHGDRFRIGEYEIEVEITGTNDFPPRESAAPAASDLDASFEVKNFISTGRREREVAAGRLRGEAAPPRAVPPAVQSPPVTSPRVQDQEQWPGLVAFCKGAGIDPLALPAEVRGTALAQAGQLLREALVGFSELARTRADFAAEFGISSGARRRDATGAFARIAAVEQILEQLLAGRAAGDARAIDEIRAQFARARQHESAMTAALREALAAVFEKLNPEALEEQLGRRAQGVAGAELQARLWNRYLELYRATAQPGDAGLPAVFALAFARAYESLAAGGSARGPGDRD